MAAFLDLDGLMAASLAEDIRRQAGALDAVVALLAGYRKGGVS